MALKFSSDGTLTAAEERRDGTTLTLSLRDAFSAGWPVDEEGFDEGTYVLDHSDGTPTSSKTFYIGTTKLFGTRTGFVQWGERDEMPRERWFWTLTGSTP